MRRLLFACFPKILTKERPSSSANIDESLELLCSASTYHLRKLENSLSKGIISLKWCCEAIDFLKIMHSHFFLLIEKSEIPSSWERVSCLNLYMEETLSLLDLCNWLKVAIFGMNRYRLIVESAFKMLCDHHELPDSRIEDKVERPDKGSEKLYGVERWKDVINFSKICSPKTKARDHDFCVVYAVKAIMNVVYMLIFCVVFYPVSVKLDYQVFDKLPQLKPISASLQNVVSLLSKRLDEMKNESRPVLVECKMIETESLGLKDEVLNTDLMQSSCMALRDGLQLFDDAVNELFEETIYGRDKLLALFNLTKQ